MTERKTKICLISPTENLAKRARALITRQGMNIRVEVADLESAVSLAKRLSEQVSVYQPTWDERSPV